MDGCLCVCTEMTASTAASHQGTGEAEQKLHMSDIFWLNIPVIKKIILSYRLSGINVWDICVYKYTMSKWAELFPQKQSVNHSKKKKKPLNTPAILIVVMLGCCDIQWFKCSYFCFSVFSKTFCTINIWCLLMIKANLKIPC